MGWHGVYTLQTAYLTLSKTRDGYAIFEYGSSSDEMLRLIIAGEAIG
jgi:hypothetical protein